MTRPRSRDWPVLVLACAAFGIGGGVARAEPPPCANAAHRSGISANLPECRAYELVTPPYKQGSKVSISATVADGSRAIALSEGNFGDAHNSQGEPGAVYALTRTLAGWSEEDLDPAASQFPFDQFRDATPDLRSTLWDLRTVSQPLDAHDLVIKDADGTLRDFGPVAPPAATTLPPGLGFPEAAGHEDGFTYQGASSDLSHVLFQVQGASTVGAKSYLWPGDGTAPGPSSGFRSLYEYVVGHAGPPALVGVGNAGNLLGRCGVSAGAANGHSAQGAISSDGAIVYFTPAGADDVPCAGAQPAVDEIFARVQGSTTVAISEPVPNAACSSSACQSVPLADAEFEGASDNGLKAFFASTQQLTDAASSDTTPGDSATAGSGAGCAATAGPHGCNLYLYDFAQPEGHKVLDLSAGDTSGLGPQVQGVLAISRDGSHAYFVAQGVLAGNTNGNGETAAAGAENLYVSEPDPVHPGQSRTVFVATLAPADSAEWASAAAGIATVTPDGRFLAFNSFAHLTAGEKSNAQQVFRYDAQTGEMTRVSFGADISGATLAQAASAQYPVRTTWRQPAAVSEDGAYVAFQSADGLAPLAFKDQPVSGGSGLAQNVYLYHAGTIGLISDGQDATATEAGASSVKALGMTASGSDVFFQTADRLASQDTDTEQDVYDARIGGGFPVPPLAAPCQEETCQGPSSAAPQFTPPSSATFSGEGNVPVPAPPITAPKPQSTPLTASQRLAKALAACHKKPRKKRSSCIREARRRYGQRQKAARHRKASG